MSDLPHLIGSREAARILGVSVATVNRWADDPAHPLTETMRAPWTTGGRLFGRKHVEEIAARRGAAA